MNAALLAVEIELQDSAVSALALTYAQEIDGGAPLEKLGPPLLAALEALRMSPRSRAAAMKGAEKDDNPVASLRSKYAR